MSRIELLRIEDGRRELYVGLDIGIVLAKDQLVDGMHLDASSHPRPGERPIIGEANVIEFPRIASSRLNLAHKQQRVFGDPELLRRQIPFVGANHISRMAVPGVFSEFGQIVAFALHDLRG